jgi:hypothetical protein
MALRRRKVDRLGQKRSAMRSTCGLNAPHERMGCGVTITTVWTVFAQWHWPIWARLPHRRFRMRAGAIAFRDGRPVMDILRGVHASTCVTVR